jgi:hypothetical protein
VIHLPDYTPAGWARLREVAPDVVMTFEEQRRKSARIALQWAEQGVAVTEITFDRDIVDRLTAWCAAEGRPVDSAARAVFGTMLALELVEAAGTA